MEPGPTRCYSPICVECVYTNCAQLSVNSAALRSPSHSRRAVNYAVKVPLDATWTVKYASLAVAAPPAAGIQPAEVPSIHKLQIRRAALCVNEMILLHIIVIHGTAEEREGIIFPRRQDGVTSWWFTPGLKSGFEPLISLGGLEQDDP